MKYLKICGCTNFDGRNGGAAGGEDLEIEKSMEENKVNGNW